MARQRSKKQRREHAAKERRAEAKIQSARNVQRKELRAASRRARGEKLPWLDTNVALPVPDLRRGENA